jgi:hypothetical protein
MGGNHSPNDDGLLTQGMAPHRRQDGLGGLGGDNS